MKKAFFLLGVLIATAHAQIGSPVPDFTLMDCGGKTVSLSDFKGKPVVLEWTSIECPFVRKHYGSGNMQKLQKDAVAKGVIWLSICSSAPGKPGYATPADAARFCSDNGSHATAYLLDGEGTVGKLFGAKRTPEMYVIDKEGILVFHGAIDDRKSPDPADVEGAKNYVAAAIDDILAGRPVSTPSTEAYGCSIKYAH